MRVISPVTWTIFSSTSRTATVSSNGYQNADGYKGVRVHIDVTSITASPSVVFSIEIRDPISGDWKTILDSAAVTATTTGPTWLTVYPGITATANASVSTHIGKQFRVTATHGDADAMVYSVAGEWLN